MVFSTVDVLNPELTPDSIVGDGSLCELPFSHDPATNKDTWHVVELHREANRE
jgi:hypothetical protein